MHGEKKMHRGFWWEILKEGGHSEGLGVHRRIILKWVLGICDVRL
jgi:hypothetical protein